MTCLLIEKDKNYKRTKGEDGCNFMDVVNKSMEERISTINKKIALRNHVRQSFLDVLDYWLNVSFPLRSMTAPKIFYPSITDEMFIESVYIDGIDILSNAIIQYVFHDIHTVLFCPDPNNQIAEEISVPTYRGNKIKFYSLFFVRTNFFLYIIRYSINLLYENKSKNKKCKKKLSKH